MPWYRLIIEVSGVQIASAPDHQDCTTRNFFASRRVRAVNEDLAARVFFDELNEEWEDRHPTFTLIDVWRVGFGDLLSKSHFGRVLFSDNYSRSKAADVLAEAADAPELSSIRKIARDIA